MENYQTGALLNEKNIKLQREYFKQFVALKGINLLYYSPKDNKAYNNYGELDTYYNKPIMVSCVYEENPTQRTMRKLGWDVELQENAIVIQVAYDTPNLQVGCLFSLPSGLDDSEGRLFKVIKMSNLAIYSPFIICELAPIYEDKLAKEVVSDFTHSNFNLLAEEEE